MANIAAAKENQETVLNGSRKDNCSKGDSCSFGHDQNKKGHGKGEASNTISFQRLKQIFQRRRQRYQGQRIKRYQPIPKARPASLLRVHAEECTNFSWATSARWYMTKKTTAKARSRKRTQIQIRQPPPLEK